MKNYDIQGVRTTGGKPILNVDVDPHRAVALEPQYSYLLLSN